MATGIGPKAEGVTAFPWPAGEKFRYAISVQGEKLNIWLESRSSKQQWQSGYLSKGEFVSAANTFVDASTMDYASYFRQCLDCLSDRSQESHRKLESRVNSGLRLELSFNLRLLESVRNANYIFELKPVAVERIDLLESRLRDQEEEMEQLRGQVDISDRAFLYAESTVWTASTLQWKPLASDKFILAADSTSITFRIPGLYAIAVLVNHWPNQNNTSGTKSLIKNDVKIQRAVTGSTNLYDSGYGNNLSAGHRTSTSLMCVVQAKEDDRIAVSCTKTTYVDDTASYLTAVRMGF